MELFKNIRLKIGKLILSKNVARKKREVYYSNFKNVFKTCGIHQFKQVPSKNAGY
jgi:hypothetical protein